MTQSKMSSFEQSTRYLFRLYAIIPFAILIILFFIFTLINGRINLTRLTTDTAISISDSIQEVYFEYEQEINRMAESPAVVDYVSTHLNGDKVYAEFYEFNNRQRVKSIFHIMDTNGVFLAYSASPDTITSDQAFTNLIHRIALHPNELLSEMNSFRYAHDRYTSYTLGRAIMKDNQIIGYLIYQLYETDLQYSITERNNEIAVVTDEHDTIVATTNNVAKGIYNKFEPTRDSQGRVILHDVPYYMVSRDVVNTPLQVYTLNSFKSEHYTYWTVSIFIVSASLLLWIMIHFLSKKMSSRHAESIDKLMFALERLREGNMDAYVDIHTKDEFEMLGNQYNEMLSRLKHLMVKNKELSELSIIAEMKQLESQFHPHFIFNVLETLRYAIKIDANQAQEIVMLLSRLLRYSISHDRLVQLKDDMNYVQDYLMLQQIRFNQRLKYTMHIAEESLHVLIPTLLVQPLIENSIKYGYLNQDTLTIDLIVHTFDDKLTFEVRDNGPGMSEGNLTEINQLLHSSDNKTSHIGLYNVHRRIMLLYGEGYGLHIESTLGTGTRVTLTIPYVKGDDHV